MESTTWRFLFGFYKIDDAIGLAKSQGIEVSAQDEAALRGRIDKAIGTVKKVDRRAGITPEVTDVPPSFSGHLRSLSAEPTFGECTTGMTSWAWKQVDLADLHTFQPSVNWDYVQRLTAKVPRSDDAEATLRFCLPLAGSGGPQRVGVIFNPVTNTFSIVTEHLDLRIVGQVQGEDPNTKRRFFGFVTGFGLPTMTAVHYRGIYLLKNGYHRAVALLAKGHKRAPMLVVETDSYQMTGAAAPGFFSIDLLSSPTAPLLSDFLTEAAVDIPRPKLRTLLTIHGEGQQVAV